MLRFFTLLALAMGAGSAPALAATTVYPVSIYSQAGIVFTPNASLGVPDGANATLFNFFSSSQIVLRFGELITGDIVLAGQRSGSAATPIRISIGEVINGVAVFSPEIVLPAGLGVSHSLALGTACSAISSAGCSLIRVRNGGGFFTSFNIDGVSGVSVAPEPAMWALMIMGFAGCGWRLKQTRPRRIAVHI